jgi:hypothetical protein
VIALGLTLPLKDLENLNLKSSKKRSASRVKVQNNMATIQKSNEYDTVNSNNDRSNVKRSSSKGTTSKSQAKQLSG